MGRQFSYFACPEDLAEIQSEVFAPMDGSLLIAEKRDGAHHLVLPKSFSLGVERMVKKLSFFCSCRLHPSRRWCSRARGWTIRVHM
jgi:hypothetical protein